MVDPHIAEKLSTSAEKLSTMRRRVCARALLFARAFWSSLTIRGAEAAIWPWKNALSVSAVGVSV